MKFDFMNFLIFINMLLPVILTVIIFYNMYAIFLSESFLGYKKKRLFLNKNRSTRLNSRLIAENERTKDF
ncbi:MAG: hypothetical protein CMM83_04190 [Rhodospirillales bacterium]|nr:hypothetical protein [Rhodospirillales bacterium]